jgi:cobalamin biosynthesis protein CobD/CbiB
MEDGAVGHNFERDPHRDHPCQVWFNLVQRFKRRRFKCDPCFFVGSLLLILLLLDSSLVVWGKSNVQLFLRVGYE